MSRQVLKILIILLLFLGSTLVIFPLEITDGKLKLILHENLGRFSLYYLLDAETGKYLPLFTDQDPRTTTLSILVNSKVYRLGDSFSFKETVEKTVNGARFTWKSSELEVTQDFTFIKSITSTESDGMKISITFNNLGENEIQIGARYIFDTYLGENDSVHFKDDTGAKIIRETKIDADVMLDHWLSPEDETTGLMTVTKGGGITTPSAVIFANWKRLNDTSWSYATSSARNFNLPPYSINDSAVCHYYYPQKLSGGLSLEIVLVMGNYSDSGFMIQKPIATTKSSTTTSSTTSATTDTAKTDTSATDTGKTTSNGSASTATTSAAPEDSLTILSIKGDISTLEMVIEEINNKINNDDFTQKDIELLEKIMIELKSKTKNYQN